MSRKVIQIDDLLSRERRDAEIAANPTIEKGQNEFERIVMKCTTGDIETETVNAICFDSIETEWEDYIWSPRSVAVPDFDTLSFWRMESDRYLKLSKAARIVFAFSATSTSCERSFSLARNQIWFRRHRLSPLTLQRLKCSSYNPMVLGKEDMIKVLKGNASCSTDDRDDERNLTSVFSRLLDS